MSSINLVMLIGNLGKDPAVLKNTADSKFVQLSLATSKKFKNKSNELQEDVQWHTVYLSNHLAQLALSYLKKGDKVFVRGELRTREVQGKYGELQRLTAIYAKELKFLSSKLKKSDALPADLVEDNTAYYKAMQDIRNVLNPVSE